MLFYLAANFRFFFYLPPFLWVCFISKSCTDFCVSEGKWLMKTWVSLLWRNYNLLHFGLRGSLSSLCHKIRSISWSPQWFWSADSKQWMMDVKTIKLACKHWIVPFCFSFIHFNWNCCIIITTCSLFPFRTFSLPP